MHIQEKQQYIPFQGPDPINNRIPPAALKAWQGGMKKIFMKMGRRGL